jgi:hypothetical protein
VFLQQLWKIRRFCRHNPSISWGENTLLAKHCYIEKSLLNRYYNYGRSYNGPLIS